MPQWLQRNGYQLIYPFIVQRCSVFQLDGRLVDNCKCTGFICFISWAAATGRTEGINVGAGVAARQAGPPSCCPHCAKLIASLYLRLSCTPLLCIFSINVLQSQARLPSCKGLITVATLPRSLWRLPRTRSVRHSPTFLELRTLQVQTNSIPNNLQTNLFQSPYAPKKLSIRRDSIGQSCRTGVLWCTGVAVKRGGGRVWEWRRYCGLISSQLALLLLTPHSRQPRGTQYGLVLKRMN